MVKLDDRIQDESWKVYDDLTDLFEAKASGKKKREDVDSEANVHGKRLKAISLVLANRIWQDGHVALQHKINSEPNTKSLSGS